MFCIWKLQGSFTSHKNAPRRWRDMIALISVLKVTLIKLWGSALGCHCPDGDGIWWKGSGGCTQSEQQPAKRSREYKVLLRVCPTDASYPWAGLWFDKVDKVNSYWRFRSTNSVPPWNWMYSWNDCTQRSSGSVRLGLRNSLSTACKRDCAVIRKEKILPRITALGQE